MKKILAVFIFLLILSGVCFALTLEDNGYAWKSADDKEKIAVCKELSSTAGKDYIYWVDVLNGFYENTNQSIQLFKIKDIAAQVPLSEQLSE